MGERTRAAVSRRPRFDASRRAALRWQQVSIAVIVVSPFYLFSASSAFSNDDSSDRREYFDVVAQPLESALQQFMEISKVAVVSETALVSGRMSTELKGRFSSEQGLRLLVSSARLYPRQIGPRAYTLEALVPVHSAQPVPRFAAYAAAIQTAVTNALCAHDETRPTHYRVVLRLWLNPAGAVTRVELDSSTGNRSRDMSIGRALGHVDIAAPLPPGFVQPVKLAILPRESAGEQMCPSDVPPGLPASTTVR